MSQNQLGDSETSEMNEHHQMYLPIIIKNSTHEIEPATSTSEPTPKSHTIYLPILTNGVPAVEDEPEQEMEQIRQEIEKMQEEMNLLQEQMDKMVQQQQQIRQAEEKYREEMEQLQQQNSSQQTDLMYRKKIGNEK